LSKLIAHVNIVSHLPLTHDVCSPATDRQTPFRVDVHDIDQGNVTILKVCVCTHTHTHTHTKEISHEVSAQVGYKHNYGLGKLTGRI